MCIDWSTDCLYPVKCSSNMNAFINHVSNKCGKQGAGSRSPSTFLLWLCFQEVWGPAVMVAIREINRHLSAIITAFKVGDWNKVSWETIRPLQLVSGAPAAQIYIGFAITGHNSPLWTCLHVIIDYWLHYTPPLWPCPFYSLLSFQLVSPTLIWASPSFCMWVCMCVYGLYIYISVQ